MRVVVGAAGFQFVVGVVAVVVAAAASVPVDDVTRRCNLWSSKLHEAFPCKRCPVLNAAPVPFFAVVGVAVGAEAVLAVAVAVKVSTDSGTTQFAVVAVAGIRSRGSPNKPVVDGDFGAVPGCTRLTETAQPLVAWPEVKQQVKPFVAQSRSVDCFAPVDCFALV